jgi:hypothetical protein
MDPEPKNKSSFTLCVRLTDAQRDKLVKYTSDVEPKVTLSDVIRQLVESDFLDIKDVLHQLKEVAQERGCSLGVLLTHAHRALSRKDKDKEKGVTS